MKKIHSILITTVAAIVLAVIGVSLVPSGVAVADQAFHTVHSPFSSLDESLYPLKDGFVISTHMNGPVNFEKKEFQLHGAKPNTQFFIYRVFQEDLRLHGTGPVLVPAGTKLYAGYSFWTDQHGEAHIITPSDPANPTLQALKGTVSAHIQNLLYDGMLPGGTLAYASDWYETFFDWEWTP